MEELGNILDQSFGWKTFDLERHRIIIAPVIQELQEDITPRQPVVENSLSSCVSRDYAHPVDHRTWQGFSNQGLRDKHHLLH